MVVVLGSVVDGGGLRLVRDLVGIRVRNFMVVGVW